MGKKRSNPYIHPAKITLVYALLVMLWIASSNYVNYISGTEELEAFIADIISGTFFTFVTSLVLFKYLKRHNIFISKKNDEISKSELKYRSLAENLDIFISRFDLELRYIYLNKQAVKMFGEQFLSENMVIGKKPTDLYRSEDACELENKVAEVILKKKPYMDVFSPDDKTFYKWRLIPELDEAGNVESVLSILFDITENINTEKELAHKTEFLNAIIETSPMAIIDLHGDGTVASLWNKTAEKMFGWTSEEAIGAFLPIIPSEKKSEYLARLNRCFNKEKLYFKALPRLNKKGETVLLDVTTCPLTDNKDKSVRVLAFIQDVTLEEQRESEIRKLSEIVKQSPDAVIVTNLDYIIEYVNPQFTELTGYTFEEAVGKSPIALLHGEIETATAEEIRKFLLSGRVWKGEFLNKKKNGEQYWASLQIGPIKDENGAVKFTVANERDITAKKQKDKIIEDSLREKEQNLREREKMLTEIHKLSEAVKQCPVSIIITDRDSKIEFVNRHFVELTGYSFEEVKGKCPSRFVHISDETNNEIDKAIAEGKNWESEILCTKKNGKKYWALMQVSYIRDNNGNIIKYIGLQQDITQMKQRDEELRRTLQEKEKMLKEIHKLSEAITQNPNPLIMTDTSGIIEYVNPAFEQSTGYSNADAVGKDPLMLLQGKSDPEITMSIGTTVGSGNIWKGEFFNNRKNGEKYWASVQIGPVRDENGIITGSVSIEQDITEKKRKDEQLSQSLHEKEVMLKEIHHRVKNNLQVVSSLLKMQSEIHPNSETIEALKTSRSRIISMALVHENLYRAPDISTIEMDDYVRKLSLNIFSSFGVTESKVRFRANTNKICLGLDTAIPLGLLMNEIITNSLKHAFPGDRRGELTLNLSSAGDKFRLNIKDDGVGLPHDFLKKSGGSLGKQLIKILSSQLDGNLTVNNGVGAEFIVDFNEIKYKKRV